MRVTASALDRRVRLERPEADTSLTGAGSGQWQDAGEAWASVQDILPSRGEKLADGMTVATRPARVRMRYRSDISTDMRLVMDGRVMQIITMPVEIGRRDGIEFMVEDYTPAGNRA